MVWALFLTLNFCIKVKFVKTGTKNNLKREGGESAKGQLGSRLEEEVYFLADQSALVLW